MEQILSNRVLVKKMSCIDQLRNLGVDLRSFVEKMANLFPIEMNFR